MAQSSNALREPSMEEILASIRRIIEESDVTPPQDELEQASDGVMSGRAAEMAVQQEPVTGKPYIAPDFNRDASETIASPVETTDSAAVDVAPEEKNVPIGKIEAAPKATLSAKTVVSEELPAATDADMADDFPPVSSGIAAADNAPTTEMGSANVNSQSILSQSAEQKVASAFEDLSYAVMEEQRQSFDDMAREILRPMLQDWLDNNLPMLVERLVREEIERVARGGRR